MTFNGAPSGSSTRGITLGAAGHLLIPVGGKFGGLLGATLPRATSHHEMEPYWFFWRKRQRELPSCASSSEGKGGGVLIWTPFLTNKDPRLVKGSGSRTALAL